MEKSAQILSEIVTFMKYAKYIPEKYRRETYKEIVDRNKSMHLKKHPSLKKEINEAYTYVYDKKVLPSMRSMQFAGKPIVLNNSRIFNCAYLPAESVASFNEIMFLLLGGTGVGFSVQRHHVAKLPPVMFPRVNPKTGKFKRRRYVISDSIEGWADAVKVLMEAYFYQKSDPDFIFDDIRRKGARLITSGGKAPGPQPLKTCLFNVRKVLDAKTPGENLRPIEVHDIVCYIADAVLAGGIRRAALISLFSFNDEEMMSAKSGSWWELNPQRARANNSAVALRHRATELEFFNFWDRVKESKSGEPGVYFSNNQEWGANPCVEIGLRPYQFCNLVEINSSDIDGQIDLEQRCRAATTIATLQASYTDFHYLREVWKETTEKDALIGVSMTGIASGAVLDLNLRGAVATIRSTNEEMAQKLGISPAARLTCVKPAGTTSCVLGTSSGIHAWHNECYFRRIRVGKNEAIYAHLQKHHPELVEDDFFSPSTQAVITVPIKAPEGAITRQESNIDFLERVRKFSVEWIQEGHIKGQNSHNVSATVTIKEDEWESTGKWMWKNRNIFNGLSVLPYDGGTYVQAPFEDCTEEQYQELFSKLTNIDLRDVLEYDDDTNLQGEIACGGGSCEIK